MGERYEDYIEISNTDMQFSDVYKLDIVSVDSEQILRDIVSNKLDSFENNVKWFKDVINYRCLLREEITKQWHFETKDTSCLVKFILGGLELENKPEIHPLYEKKYYKEIIEYCEQLSESYKTKLVDYSYENILVTRDQVPKDLQPKAFKRSLTKLLNKQSKQLNDEIRVELMKVVHSKYAMSLLLNISSEIYKKMLSDYNNSSWFSWM